MVAAAEDTNSMSATTLPNHNDQPTSPATTVTMNVAVLRRSSSHVTPTRTLRLSEQEHREVTPVRVTQEYLERPRSNQRTRTPRRYESPMDPDAFRRTSPANNNNDHNNEAPATRILIHTGDRGTDRTRPISEVPLSHKQGPSHRKVRRWRNDHFDDLASAVTLDNGHRAADALRKAKEKAHLYRDVVNFNEMQSDTLTRFIKDDKLYVVREKFCDGELPISNQVIMRVREKPRPEKLSAQEKLYSVDARLRRVVAKACRNSQPAAMVVKTFESFVRATYSHKKQGRKGPVGHWWCTLLTEEPTVTKRLDGKITVQFLFDANSPTGGFHRLLLHAICQYHGLQVLSKVVNIEEKSNRALIATGEVIRSKHKLLDQLIDDADKIEIVEEPWTMV